MFNVLRKKLYFIKYNTLMKIGAKNGMIVPFDDEFYEKMSHTIFGCLPVSMNIKYLKPISSPGKCADRSLMMFFCFDDALLVHADVKSLELEYGKDQAWHYWIEIGNYVYDPTSLKRFDKDLYYQIYLPTNVCKCTKEEYCMEEVNRELYNDITSTTISDYQPDGEKRYQLRTVIPLVAGIAEISKNIDFIVELENWLKIIQYETKAIDEELSEDMKNYVKIK